MHQPIRVAVLCCLAFTVQAEPIRAPVKADENTATALLAPQTSTSTYNIGRLEAIQAETVLYQAQLAREKVVLELQKNGYDGENRPFNPVAPTQDKPSKQVAATSRQSPPRVIEISGNGKYFTALLIAQNGNQFSVRSGQQIPGTDYTVARINVTEVVVNRPGLSPLSLSFAE